MTIPGMPPMGGGDNSGGGVNFGQLLKDAGGSFQPLPKGEYDAIVATSEAKESSTGKLMFALTYKIVGGPYNGRTVYNNVTLTVDNPNALRMFFLNMKAMGLDEAFFSQSPAPSVVAQALLDKPCKLVIDHRPYQGEMRESVKSIKPPMLGGIQVPGAMNVGPGPIVPPASPQAPAVPAQQPAPAQPAAPVAIPQPTNPAPAEPVSPAPTPAPVAPVEAPAPVEPPAAPAEVIPPGYEAIWATMPDAAKQAILASMAPAATAPAAAAPVQQPPSLTPPPPVVF